MPGTYRKRIYMSLVHTDSFRQTPICANSTLRVNQKIIDQIKANITEDKSMFKTISGKNFTSSRARLKMRINKIEKEIDVYIVHNDNFTYDLILGLDAIRKFKLKQNENLRVAQKVNDKEEEIISNKKEERKNNQKRREINITEDIEIDKFINNLGHLDNSQKKEVFQLIEKYKEIFAKHKFDVGTRKLQDAYKIKHGTRSHKGIKFTIFSTSDTGF